MPLFVCTHTHTHTFQSFIFYCHSIRPSLKRFLLHLIDVQFHVVCVLVLRYLIVGYVRDMFRNLVYYSDVDLRLPCRAEPCNFVLYCTVLYCITLQYNIGPRCTVSLSTTLTLSQYCSVQYCTVLLYCVEYSKHDVAPSHARTPCHAISTVTARWNRIEHKIEHTALLHAIVHIKQNTVLNSIVDGTILFFDVSLH